MKETHDGVMSHMCVCHTCVLTPWRMPHSYVLCVIHMFATRTSVRDSYDVRDSYVCHMNHGLMCVRHRDEWGIRHGVQTHVWRTHIWITHMRHDEWGITHMRPWFICLPHVHLPLPCDVTHSNESRHTESRLDSVGRAEVDGRHMDAACHTYECVTSHTWRSQVTHVNRRLRGVVTCECVMSLIWMEHIAHVNMSRHTYERVKSRISIARGQLWVERGYRRQVCCIVLQCVAVCCSVLQCVAVCCSVLQCVALCCSGRLWARL